MMAGRCSTGTQEDGADPSLMRAQWGAFQVKADESLDIFINVLFISGGWLLATFLMPDRGIIYGADMRLSGLAISAGVLAGPLIAFLRNVSSAFKAQYVLMLGLFFWILLDAVQTRVGFSGVSVPGMQRVFNSIALFAIMVHAGCLLVPRKKMLVLRALVIEDRRKLLFFIGIVCFALGMLRVVLACRFNPLCVIDAMYSSRFQAAWQLAGLGNLDTLLEVFRYAGFLVLPVAVAMYRLERRVTRRVLILSVFGVVILLILVADGARRHVGIVIGASLLVWVLLHHSFRLKHALILVSSVMAAIYLMQAMVTWRDQGFLSGLSSESEVSFSGGRGVRVDTNLKFFAHVADVVPTLHPHTGMTGIEYILTYPLPRVIYPDKPIQRGFPLKLTAGLKRGVGWSWMMTAVGDFYLISGYLGVLFGGVFFGVMAGFANRLISIQANEVHVVLYAAAVMTLFVALRAAHELTMTGLMVLQLVGIIWFWRFYAEGVRRKALTIANGGK